MASGADLLERMRRSPDGHSAATYERLLLHFGFKQSEQKNHTKYRHELLEPGAVVTVPRHRKIRGHVAKKAVKAVDFVRAEEKRLREAEEKKRREAEANGPQNEGVTSHEDR